MTKFCTERNLPRLTYLAVNGKSELPKVLKKEPDAKNKFEIITKQIYEFNWQTIANPFADEGSDNDIDTKAVPVLLLEDLSSKESVVKNEQADEVLRLRTPVIESSNETSIDSEENKEHNEKEEVFHKHMRNGLKTISTTRKQKTFINPPALHGEQK